ncbi:leucine--tRNA ligase [Methanobrevibacter sp. DSM 116169]|uniref:leucine--tRNA ligase n=1 Tax=Methanobrevibacter sp. DSM 116169 TaxID=3242727 RepID=UPI0038FC3B1B
MDINIEKKWQKKWEDNKLFQSNPNNKQKLFLTVAYPYPSGAMHIGHGRTYTVPDVYARFKRMEGFNVLFPMAWHVTGAPVIGIASRIKRKEKWTMDLYENVHKVPKEELSKLEDPEYIVKYFSGEYHDVMNDMGYSIDWRREFRTTDPTYKKFIEWQIKKLKEKDLIKKGEHPVKYCPNCQNPVGDHDLLEGEGVGVNELTLLKFKYEDKILVTATFRPETISGATNIWMNPDIKYIAVDSNGENWIISEDSYHNLSNQIKDLKVLGDINPKELIGNFLINPKTNDKLPILPASFVDGEYGSGVVFSVPGHAPADYIALKDLKNNDDLISEYNLKEILENVNPINVVTVKGYGEFPAQEIIEKLQVKSQEDPKLEEATNELYKIEHSKGIMSEHIPKYNGEKVAIARDDIRDEMIRDNTATIMYDFAERPIVCRCGTNCVVKIMDDQWFIKYSDVHWKEKTFECLGGETIIPNEVRNNFEYYIDWLEDWACSRRIGLGTKLPWDDKWLIEPLTDSTIYMSYYTIAKYLKEMNPEELNDAFFDKVFLDIDSSDINVDIETVNQIQSEFNYWYPLDWRLSAKDLVGNHLSFLMFHHSAIFPQPKWPKGTVVFGMGLLEGNKMSSSKGNVILLKEAIEEYSADVVRLFLMSSAEPWQDFDWREKEVLGTQRRLQWFIEFPEKIEEINGSSIDLNSNKKIELNRPIDLWMMNQLNLRIKNATEALELFQTRKALQESFFLLKKDIDHYMHRNQDNDSEEFIYVLTEVFKKWLKILTPFTPHTCEELWEKYFGKGFISIQSWPEYDESSINEEIERSEEMIQTIIKDIGEIKKMINEDVEKIHIYLAPEWKWEMYEIADNIGKPDVGQIIGRSIKANIHNDKKEIAEFAKKIGREITKTKYIGKIDEAKVLNNAKDFIANEYGDEIVIHTDNDFDPENKARNALPYKPAIYME